MLKEVRAYFALPLAAALGLAGFLATGAIAQPATTAGCAATGHTIALCRTNLGRVLVNSKGHTLYLFKKDKNGKSACYGSCATFWPPLLRHGKPTLGPGLKKSLLGTTKRRNGTTQLTYNKHPLYTYKLDTHAGQTKGQGSTAFGAKWYALSATGKAITMTRSTTTGTTTTTPTYSTTSGY
jgi:predicted lipoprotein with Yx(FWY)xxD motif